MTKNRLWAVLSCSLLYCYCLSWSQGNLALTWEIEIHCKESASKADAEVLRAKHPNVSMVFNVSTRSELQLVVSEKSITARAKLPIQLEIPAIGRLSKVALSEYYAFFSGQTCLIATGDLINIVSEGSEIPINRGIIWKPSKNLLTVGSPTGVQDPVWMPSLILLCYLSHKDIQFVEKLSGVKFTPSTKSGTRIYTYESGDGETVIRLFYSDDLPEKMEIYSMGETVQVISEGKFSVEPTKTPYRVRYARAAGNRREEVVFNLKQVQMANSDNNEPTLPLGVTIYDYRLLGKDLTLTQMRESEDKAIQYRWKGKLISEDELRQLAYQEGSLLPPETPQRRYSFWMFLPAIALFGLALLFYLRRRR